MGNASGGQGIGLYGRRLWSDIKSCLLGSIHFVFNNFIIGQPGSPMSVGQTTLTINQTGIIQDSIFVTLVGSELPRNDNSQISYTVSFNPTNAVITFNQAASNGQQYIVHMAYTN